MNNNQAKIATAHEHIDAALKFYAEYRNTDLACLLLDAQQSVIALANVVKELEQDGDEFKIPDNFLKIKFLSRCYNTQMH